MSEFVVSARKYRPTSFAEVIGQEHITTTFENAIRNNKIGHAYLFCGPRGVGKTTCARILAKVLNGDESGDAENLQLNIFELDAASNNSVEDIRNLVEQVRFAPQQGKYKVYIIDEVHMLSSAAFNAFLKTLEEPPPYAIFILATTEKHKVIPTILSRCQIFDFKRVPVDRIVEHLRGICEKENLKASEDALHIIAQKADGSVRDSLSIFDRLASISEELTYDLVVSNLNVLDYDYFFRVTDALLQQDAKESMLILDEILSKGFEGDDFMLGLGGHFRNLLMCKDPDTVRLLEVSEAVRQRYSEQSQRAAEGFLLTGLNFTNDCDINYRMAKNKRLLVELYLLKICFSQTAVTAGELKVEVEKKKPDTGINQLPAEALEKDQAVETAPESTDSAENSGYDSAETELSPEAESAPETQPVAEPVEATSEEPIEEALKKVGKRVLRPDEQDPESALEPPENEAVEEFQDVNADDSAEPVLADEPAAAADPPAVKALRKTSKIGDLDSLAAELPGQQLAEEADASALADSGKPLSMEVLAEKWAAYLEELKARKEPTAELSGLLMKLAGRQLEVEVDSHTLADIIRPQMKEFADILHEKQGFQLLDINFNVQQDTAGIEKRKPLSPSDKHAYLLERKPELGDLVDRLGLDIDY